MNNFTLLNDSLRSKITQVVCASWDKSSVESTETCLAIIINLKLQSAYEFFKKEFDNVMDNEVKAEMDDAFTELGEIL